MLYLTRTGKKTGTQQTLKTQDPRGGIMQSLQGAKAASKGSQA